MSGWINRWFSGRHDTSSPHGDRKLPSIARLAFVGDSFTRMGIVENPEEIVLGEGVRSSSYSNFGYLTYAQMLAGEEFFVPADGVRAINGDTAFDARRRLDAEPLPRVDVVVIFLGTNDLARDRHHEEIQRDLASIYQRFRSQGTLVVAPTIAPRRPGSDVGLTSAQEARRRRVNEWLLNHPSVDAVDMDQCLNEESHWHDGFHPSALGAYRIGAAIATTLRAIQPKVGAAAAICSVTPKSIGRFGGADGVIGAGVWGTAATAWSVVADTGADVRVRAEQTADGDGQRIRLDGTYVGDHHRIRMQRTFDVDLRSAAYYAAVLRFQLSGHTSGLSGVDVTLSVQCPSSGEYLLHGRAFYASLRSACPLPAGEHTIRTPPQAGMVDGPATMCCAIDILLANAPVRQAVTTDVTLRSFHMCQVATLERA